MEVIVHSTLSTIGGQVTVATDPNQSIDSLITAFCVEKGIPHRQDYVLKNRDQEILEATSTLSAARVLNGDILFLSVQGPGEKGGWLFGCNQWWVLAGVALLIGTMGIAAVSIIRVEGTVQPDAYGVVMDAGSSHTQLFVYRWPADKLDGTGIVEQDLSCRAKGHGISEYVDNPLEAGGSLQECLDEAVERVPRDKQAATPLFLGATAGMRLLRDSDNVTGSKASEQILASVRATMASYPFKFSQPLRQARILEGQEEGAFGWVTVNFLNGTFGHFESQLSRLFLAPSPAIPVSRGAMDMGGASTQITFIPDQASQSPPAYMEDLTLYGDQYSVYTHSYLCYGLNEAYRQYLAHLVMAQNYTLNVTNPCGAIGTVGNGTVFPYSEIFELPCTLSKPSNDSHRNDTYTFVGSSDSASCNAMVKTIFDFDTPCSDPPCTFNGVHQPKLNGEFMAFSGFYYTMEFLNLTSKPATLEDFDKATEEFCLRNWTDISHEHAAYDRLQTYCFQAHYIRTLLVDGYKFDKDTWSTITFTNTTGTGAKKVDLGWSLGFMLNTSNIVPEQGPIPSISLGVFVPLLILFLLFVVLAVGFGCFARRYEGDGQIRRRYQRMSSYGAV